MSRILGTIPYWSQWSAPTRKLWLRYPFFFLISLGITKQAIWYVANVSTKCLMHTPFPDGERSLLLHPLRQTFNFSRTGSKHCILDWWVKSGTPRYLSFDFMRPTVGIARISLILEFETELLKNAPDLS